MTISTCMKIYESILEYSNGIVTYAKGIYGLLKVLQCIWKVFWCILKIKIYLNGIYMISQCILKDINIFQYMWMCLHYIWMH